ncbi:actin-like ATPase domain-containing protein [Aspergillus granulosus]|uniref:Actin-like ATPase domain-containing protein n=1 Tax=Aspergillus granulosus TaxID=176169 RepID=A0ABR4HU01_9EURO
MSLRHSQSTRSPPHTPQHQLRSNNNSFASNSSGSTYRVEEDAIIFELGARWLRAGFEGESEPKCIVGFGPEESRRVGDYRGWLRGTAAEQETPTRPVKPEDWTRPYELWRMDLRDVDLGLVEDKIERSIRETYNKYLLTDAGLARLALVLPSVVPHPLLSSILTTLFSRWRFPSITLLNNAAMATTAAGLRSALVVDIGWAETVVTGIYEYREVVTKRSIRAMKALIQETGRLITRITDGESSSEGMISVDFEYCEEVASRFLWCKPSRSTGQDTLSSISDKMVSIPSPSDPGSSYIDLPFSKLTEPVEKVLFAQGVADADLDDEEKSLSLVVYNTLVSLPPDVRGICMSRIVFIGGGANIAGVRRRVLDEVGTLVKQYGWSPVRGKVIDQNIKKLQDLKLSRKPPPGYETAKEQTESESSGSEGGYETADEPDTEIDPIEQKLQRAREKEAVPIIQGVVREVETLGSWAGASLVTSLKVRGMVEIEREKYLQQGLAGATREWDHSHKDAKDLNLHSQIPDRRSGLRTGGDRSSWTLAGWG